MTLAAPPSDRARCIANPAKVAAAESALLAVQRDRPRLTTAEIAVALGDDNRAGLKARIYRMADRGAIERAGRGRWRIAGQEAEPEPVEPVEPEPGAQSRWIKPLSAYERRETTVDQGLRYG
jgi:hypothetical protein